MGQSRSNHLSSFVQSSSRVCVSQGAGCSYIPSVPASSQDMIFQRMQKPVDLGCFDHSQQFGNKGASPSVHNVL